MADAAREAADTWGGRGRRGRRAADDPAGPQAGSPGSALARILRTYIAARAAVGVALAAGMAAFGLAAANAKPWLLLVCGAYALQAVGLWLWPRLSWRCT